MVKFKKEFNYIGGKFELDTEYRSKWFDGYLLIYMFDEGNEEHVRFNYHDIDRYIEEECWIELKRIKVEFIKEYKIGKKENPFEINKLYDGAILDDNRILVMRKNGFDTILSKNKVNEYIRRMI